MTPKTNSFPFLRRNRTVPQLPLTFLMGQGHTREAKIHFGSITRDRFLISSPIFGTDKKKSDKLFCSQLETKTVPK
jgi:hypothetical protein